MIRINNFFSYYIFIIFKPSSYISNIIKKDINPLITILVVIISGLVSSASFLINGGRTWFIFLSLLSTFFGETALANNFFFMAYGTLLYVIVWVYLSIATYIFLRLFNEHVSLKNMFEVISFGFLLPQSYIIFFGIAGNYYIHLIGIIIFCILLPISITPSLMRKAANADFYKRCMSLYISSIIPIYIWFTLVVPTGLL